MGVLATIGFVFDVSENTWKRFIESVQHFVLRTGHCDVPSTHKEGDFALGGIVQSIRCRECHIKRNGVYLVDRMRTLLQLEFVWSSDRLKDQGRRCSMQALMS